MPRNEKQTLSTASVIKPSLKKAKAASQIKINAQYFDYLEKKMICLSRN